MKEKENIKETEAVEIPVERQVIELDSGMSMPSFRSDEEMNFFLDQIERRNKAVEIILKRALQRLLPTDFHDFEGKPLLQGVGCQRILKNMYISVSNVRRIPSEGEGYEIVEGDTSNRLRVTYRGDFSIGTMTVPGIGIRDTHNLFLCKKGDTYKELADIKLPHLDTSAMTAMYRDGISTLLGLKGITWEYLEELGFNRSKTTGHTYKTGSAGGDMAGSDEKTHEIKTKIGNMLLEMSKGDTERAAEMLADYTKWGDKPGRKELKMLTVKQTPVIYGKVKKDYEGWIKEYGKSDEPVPEEDYDTEETNQQKIPF